MEDDTLKRLSQTELDLFQKLAQAYAYYDIPLIMTDHVTQRGGILSEFVSYGGRAYIAGGKDGQQFFKNVPQFTLPYDTFCEREANSVKDIASRLPQSIAKSGKFGLFLYTPMGDCLWSKAVKEHLGAEVIATNEQNFRSYFEEKTNLADILRMAGLEKHIIPSVVVRNARPLSEEQTRYLYERLSSSDGKVVVQSCGEGNNEKGGGHSTEVATTYEEFKDICTRERESYLKIAKYISGCNSNLSICAGNTVPSETMFGATKGTLLEGDSRFSGDTLQALLQRGRELGITEDNIVVNVHPGTLKVVGASQLTTAPTNGVGNQLNYRFKKETLNEIYDMGHKLGTLMALCGKVGLCGLDLIIDKDGTVYVNELNDRQQGPTESASLNNEAHGLPGIHRMAFLMNFGDVSNPEVAKYLTDMNEHAREIYFKSTEIPSPFYIKVMALNDSVSKVNLHEGDYHVLRDDRGRWSWDVQHPAKGDGPREVDIQQDDVVMRINTVSATEGDFIPQETQFLRINGLAVPGAEPFAVNESGCSVLAKSWEGPISALYDATLKAQLPVQESDESLEISEDDVAVCQ